MRVGAYERAAMLSELQDENYRLAARLEAQEFIAKTSLAAAGKHAEEVMRLRDLLREALPLLTETYRADELYQRIDAALSSTLGQGESGAYPAAEGMARAEAVATPGTPGGGASVSASGVRDE